MEKNILKRVLINASPGDLITVNYSLSGPTEASGDYTVIGTKKGRGKGGSMIAELKSESGSTLVVGTKDSDVILNVVVNNELFGYKTEAEVPVEYPKDAANGIALKRLFKTITTTPTNVKISSTIPEFDGDHVIVKQRQLRGRSGQIALTTATGLEIWSYRHSGIINNIKIG